MQFILSWLWTPIRFAASGWSRLIRSIFQSLGGETHRFSTMATISWIPLSTFDLYYVFLQWTIYFSQFLRCFVENIELIKCWRLELVADAFGRITSHFDLVWRTPNSIAFCIFIHYKSFIFYLFLCRRRSSVLILSKTHKNLTHIPPHRNIVLRIRQTKDCPFLKDLLKVVMAWRNLSCLLGSICLCKETCNCWILDLYWTRLRWIIGLFKCRLMFLNEWECTMHFLNFFGDAFSVIIL
jgi:hypothetical protein